MGDVNIQISGLSSTFSFFSCHFPPWNHIHFTSMKCYVVHKKRNSSSAVLHVFESVSVYSQHIPNISFSSARSCCGSSDKLVRPTGCVAERASVWRTGSWSARAEIKHSCCFLVQIQILAFDIKSRLLETSISLALRECGGVVLHWSECLRKCQLQSIGLK